ncbi:MAG: hypothetical protein AAB964_00460 [Patescibacteria group bacterium]
MSSTYIANITGFLLWVAPMLGLNLNATELTTTLTTLVAVGSGVWIFIGRFRAGGITWWGGRKEKGK